MTTNPIATMANYAASKAAVYTMTRAWAKELAKDGVRDQFTRRGAHRNPYLWQDRAFGRGRESPQGYGNEERASR